MSILSPIDQPAAVTAFQRSLADAQQILDRLLGTDEGCIMPALCAGTTANWSVDALMTV